MSEVQEKMDTHRRLHELPPRKLTWFSKLILLCNDIASQSGWALIAIGSIVFWTTIIRSEVKYWFEDHSLIWEEKAGVILESDATGSTENKVPIWSYKHSFNLNREIYKGLSYSVGKKFDSGQIAFIRYDSENPLTNYIIGMRRSQFSWRVNLLLLIPLLGVILLVGPIRHNLKVLKLLEIGDFTRGKLVSKEITKHSVKKGGIDRPVFKYHFEFKHNDAIYQSACRTHRIDSVEDEETEIVLFDKYNPSFNLVYDSILHAPEINAEGNMMQVSSNKATFLFLPTFTLAINIVFLLFG